MGPQNDFLHKELGIICLTNIYGEPTTGRTLCWAQDSKHDHAETCCPHLGVHLGLHDGPHHCSSTRSGAFHFHFKCLPALIQKLGRDKLVRMQTKHVNEPKTAFQPSVPPTEVVKVSPNPVIWVSRI